MPLALDEILLTCLKNVGKLFPARIIKSNEQGVRFFMGEPKGPLHKGLYFFYPFVGSMDIVGTMDGDVDLGTITVPVGDKSISTSGGLIYNVNDAYKYLIKLDDNDAKKTLRLIGRGYVSEALEKDYEAFRKDRANALMNVRKKMEEETNDRYGVGIRRIWLADFVNNAIPIRHMSDAPQEPSRLISG